MGPFVDRLLWGGDSFPFEVPGLVGGTLYPQSISYMEVSQGFGDQRFNITTNEPVRIPLDVVPNRFYALGNIELHGNTRNFGMRN